ncbi:MAG: enoyl-CoA hydratase/isomerase [Marmoricola sp.]|nr:enoyl-CoA hydratase/isomerase [Marmoricola sp.]
MSAYETLAVDRTHDGVTLVTLDRPERSNAMTDVMFSELEDLCRGVETDDACRVVVLTGAGRAFCAGYDLELAEDLAGLGALGMLDKQERAARSMVAVRSLRVPVIAAVNGAAAGGGLALALAADVRLASTAASFNAAFTRIGLSAGDLGCSWLLTRLIGPARTSEICFTGRRVAADEAAEIGLVNAVHAPDELLDRALGLADAMIANSPGGVQMSKRALHANMEAASYAAAIELENRGQALLTRTSDMVEALAAFKEKRTPEFRRQ